MFCTFPHTFRKNRIQQYSKKIMKYKNIICFYISKLKFSFTIIKYQIDTF